MPTGPDNRTPVDRRIPEQSDTPTTVAARAVKAQLAQNTILDGRYRIEELLGMGGMSTVYRARHLKLDRSVAIKMLHQHLLNDRKVLERFVQEARTESILKHRNILSAQAFGITPEGQLYLVTDYISGRPLSTCLLDGPLDQNSAWRVFMQICDGLSYAHQQGVVHRDLKPSNIMVIGELSNPGIKILDFGIAKLLNADKLAGQLITRAGVIVGTPAYMSPEQCMGEPLDARSDIYSLGCMIFETLTGQIPFRGSTELGTMSRHINEPAPKFGEVDPNTNISPDLEKIVLKAMEKQPARRYQSVEEMRRAFEEADLMAPYPRHTRKLSFLSPIVPTSASAERNGTTRLDVWPVLRGSSSDPKNKLWVLGGLAATVIVAAGLLWAINPASFYTDGLERRVAEAREEYGSNSKHALAAELSLADAHYSLNRRAQASKEYAEILSHVGSASAAVRDRIDDIMSRAYARNPGGLCMAAQRAAQALIVKNDFKNAELALRIASYKTPDAPRWERVGALAYLSEFLKKQGRFEDALKATRDGLDLARSGTAGLSRDTAISSMLMRMGDEYWALKQYSKARDCFDNVLTITWDVGRLSFFKEQAKGRLVQLHASGH